MHVVLPRAVHVVVKSRTFRHPVAVRRRRLLRRDHRGRQRRGGRPAATGSWRSRRSTPARTAPTGPACPTSGARRPGGTWPGWSCCPAPCTPTTPGRPARPACRSSSSARTPTGAGCSAVLADNRSGVREAVAHLIGHGHERIAFAGHLAHFDLRNATRATARALLAHGLTPARRPALRHRRQPRERRRGGRRRADPRGHAGHRDRARHRPQRDRPGPTGCRRPATTCRRAGRGRLRRHRRRDLSCGRACRPCASRSTRSARRSTELLVELADDGSAADAARADDRSSRRDSCGCPSRRAAGLRGARPARCSPRSSTCRAPSTSSTSWASSCSGRRGGKGEGEVMGVEVGVSIGVAVSSDGASDPDHLLREADAAMYQAKELRPSPRGLRRPGPARAAAACSSSASTASAGSAGGVGERFRLARSGRAAARPGRPGP